jgi:cell shape-determining protein MreC
MRTNFHLKSRNQNRLGKRIILLAVLFILGAVFFSFTGKFFVTIASPVWKGQNIISNGFRNSFSWLKSKDALIKENMSLKESLKSKELEMTSLRSSRDREKELLSILGRVEDGGGILSSVLVRPPETPYDVLIIDVGTNEGIEVGYRVALPEGIIIGTVSEVFANSSKVILYSASGEKTNAVLERNNAPIIMDGRGGGNFRITLPRDMAVEEGDRILSSDITSTLIAVVGKVNLGATDSFKEVLATSPANIFTLRYVLVRP